MEKQKLKVGLVGCGDIARKAYLPFSAEKQNSYAITACCDMRREYATQVAEKFNIPKVYETSEALIADSEIDIVLNLTHPAGHAPLNLAALQAGKHAYCEKPFAVTLDEGKAVIEEAERSGLKIGCAPDTVLGPGTQACREVIESGALGEILSAKLQFTSPGHEHWHPNPAFYYKAGGGPLLDMGPYYLSFLISTLGPIRSVMGRARRGFNKRVIRNGKETDGQEIEVEVPTFYTGSLETEGGVVVTLDFSFDHPFGCSGTRLPEIYGTEGALIGINPNKYDGAPVLNKQWAGGPGEEQPVNHSYSTGRGLGLVEFVDAIRENREPRCSGKIAHHLLEVMLAFEVSERTRAAVTVESTCEKPAPMPASGLDE